MLAWPGLAHAHALADPCTARSSQQPAACPPLLSSLQAPDQPSLVLLGPRPRLLPLGSSLPLEPCRAGFSLTSKPRCSKTSTVQEHPPLLHTEYEPWDLAPWQLVSALRVFKMCPEDAIAIATATATATAASKAGSR
jgi:hypothetical protein